MGEPFAGPPGLLLHVIRGATCEQRQSGGPCWRLATCLRKGRGAAGMQPGFGCHRVLPTSSRGPAVCGQLMCEQNALLNPETPVPTPGWVSSQRTRPSGTIRDVALLGKWVSEWPGALGSGLFLGVRQGVSTPCRAGDLKMLGLQMGWKLSCIQSFEPMPCPMSRA